MQDGSIGGMLLELVFVSIAITAPAFPAAVTLTFRMVPKPKAIREKWQTNLNWVGRSFFRHPRR